MSWRTFLILLIEWVMALAACMVMIRFLFPDFALLLSLTALAQILLVAPLDYHLLSPRTGVRR